VLDAFSEIDIGTVYNQSFCDRDISHIPLLLEGASLQWGLVVFHPTTATEDVQWQCLLLLSDRGYNERPKENCRLGAMVNPMGMTTFGRLKHFAVLSLATNIVIVFEDGPGG
jgi:hypothetical protein